MTIQIPYALDPHGTEIPIQEATRFKTDYYICPECKEYVDPRIGTKRQYFAHKAGVLEDTDCELSSQVDIDELVDDLRESDIEKQERERNIRVYLGEEPGGRHTLFGVVPSVEWAEIPNGADIDSLLSEVSIEAEGVKRPPTGRSFHPTEPEVRFSLEPAAADYRLEVDAPSALSNIGGVWSADGLSDGDLFVGDQTRARRHNSQRQIKPGEWVYIVGDEFGSSVPDESTEHQLDEWAFLALPAREDTAELLEQYGIQLNTDNYGFDADIILPASAHPTSEAPIEATPSSKVLVSITPDEELDPIFEIVPIPRESGSVEVLDQTGPGNPRFYSLTVPDQGSKRVTVHQRNSSRHRLIHVHATPPQENTSTQPLATEREIGLEISTERHSTFISPVGEKRRLTLDPEFQPMQLPAVVQYQGPDGLSFEITARFSQDSSMNRTIRRADVDLTRILPSVGQWVSEGCQSVEIEFSGMGAVVLEFAQNLADQRVEQ